MISISDFKTMISERGSEKEDVKKFDQISEDLQTKTVETYVGMTTVGYDFYALYVLDLNIHGRNPKTSLTLRNENGDDLHLTIEL